MYTIDEDLVSTLQMYLWTLMAVFGTVFVISGVTPIFTVCLVPIIAFYAIEQTFFTVSFLQSRSKLTHGFLPRPLVSLFRLHIAN